MFIVCIVWCVVCGVWCVWCVCGGGGGVCIFGWCSSCIVGFVASGVSVLSARCMLCALRVVRRVALVVCCDVCCVVFCVRCVVSSVCCVFRALCVVSIVLYVCCVCGVV